MTEVIIDATNAILGRLCTSVAKRALLGESIKIVNCENAIITGSKREILAKYKQRYDRGVPSKGPFQPRMPDRFVRRTVRGMLPYKQDKGRQAFKRIMCYIGVPEEVKDKKLETIKTADASKLDNFRFITVNDVCKELGAKYNE